MRRPLAAAVAMLACASAAHAQAPQPANAQTSWVHAPYEVGACGVCHVSADAKKPGPISGPVTALCLGCHEETRHAMSSAVSVHDPAKKSCTTCHHPHEASTRMLLVKEVPAQCIGCHSEMEQHAADAKARHTAVAHGQACLGCHDPHATGVANLLKGPP